MDEPMRYERLRFYLAGVVTVASVWGFRFGLMSLAAWLGIPLWVEFDHPVTVRWPNTSGIGWVDETFTREMTWAHLLLMVLALVMAYYVARITYRLSVSAVLDRRNRWLLAGWFVFTALMIALSRMLSAMFHPPSLPSGPDWAWTGDVVGVVGLFVILVLTNLFVSAWGRLMRWCKVPAKSAD
ncbi:hypothetical protein [Dyella sp. OK004]|uniref:hypothetical protein n=1 Tax=Dyella sp. OK004 TaxID=1855292 RepID=UPI000B88A150|nr:hypothetical protein [Dyella sp. OK004]